MSSIGFQIYINCYATYKQIKKELNKLLRDYDVSALASSQEEYYDEIKLYTKRHGLIMKDMRRVKSCWINRIQIYKDHDRICSKIEIDNRNI